MSDLFLAVRRLLNAKLFAVGVVLTLGIGIGATTAIISLIRVATPLLRDAESSDIVAIFVLLLIVCVNLTGLLLSHGLARRHDLAVRIALGAPRGTIVRQLVIEWACLGLGGGVAGLIIASWIVELFVSSPRPATLGQLGVGTSPATVGLALTTSVVLAILVGLAAIRTVRAEVQADLKNRDLTTIASHGRGHLARVLVVAQFALSFVLLTDASPAGTIVSFGWPVTDTPSTVLLDAMALLLAAIGLNGLIAYSAGQRAREIGMRVALGARRLDVVSFLTRQGLWLVGLGLAIGIAGSIVLRSLTPSRIGAGAPLDPAQFGRAALALVIVALLATYLPARRASRIDPMVTLRGE